MLDDEEKPKAKSKASTPAGSEHADDILELVKEMQTKRDERFELEKRHFEAGERQEQRELELMEAREKREAEDFASCGKREEKDSWERCMNIAVRMVESKNPALQKKVLGKLKSWRPNSSSETNSIAT